MNGRFVRQFFALAGMRFVILSGVSFLLSFLLTVFWVEVARIGPLPAHVITLVLVFFWNYAGLVFFVFRESQTSKWKAFQGFLLTSIIFRCSEWLSYAAIISFLGVDYRLAVLVVVPLFALLKYVLLKKRVFSPPAAPCQIT